MSALLIDLPLAEVPTPARGRRWMHAVADPAPAEPSVRVRALPPVEPVRPLGRPADPVSRAVPQARPVQGRATAPVAPLRLTRRGLAVVVGGFGLLMLTALVVLVTAFLGVSNDPIVTSLPLN